MLDRMADKFDGLVAFFSGYGFIYSPVYLATSLAIAMLYAIVVRPGAGLMGYLFPSETYRHPSTRADLSIASANLLFVGLGGFAFIVLTPLVAGAVMLTLTDPTGFDAAAELSFGWGALLVVLLVLTEDFARYAVHRAHHALPAIWPFHAVHHSAEVLTPITFFRAHPMYYLLQHCLISVLAGASQGFVVAVAFGRVPGWVFFAAVLVSRAYFALGVHLRHSHVPLGYGRAIEHLLISPRQHQVHHSIEPRHYDTNFGEIFAIWDWLFGTLYIPVKDEVFEFGLIDADGERIQPHPTLRAAMLVPFAESARALRGSRRLPEDKLEQELERDRERGPA